MTEGPEQISLPTQIGFGWTPQRGPTVDEDGGMVFEYRYIPSGLWMIDGSKIFAQINRAANVYATFDEYPPDLIGEEPPDGQLELTPAGLAFFQSCPLYARFHAKQPYITWTAYRPDGEKCFVARSGNFGTMMPHAITCTPIELWAKVCFEPWGHLFEPHPTHGFWPMHMQEAPQANSKEWISHGPLERPESVPTAQITERVEFPFGLFKTVYASVAWDHVETCKSYPSTDEMELMKCSLAVRRAEADPFEWKDHWVFRFTVPAQYVGRMLHWMHKNEFEHPGTWSVRSVVPVFGPELVDVKFNFTPEVGGYETLFIVLKPLEELDMSARLQYEMDVSHMDRPERPPE